MCRECVWWVTVSEDRLAPANHTVGSSVQRSGETHGLVAGSHTAILRVTSAASMS